MRRPIRLPALLLAALPLQAQEPPRPFAPLDVFQLEWASDPRLSPDGERIVYVRGSMDVMADRQRASLWTIEVASGLHRPLTDGTRSDSSPRWSPDGARIAYVTGEGGGTPQLWMRWLPGGESARLTQLTESPAHLCWSPDGRWLAFTMRVRVEPASFVQLPKAPEGARWADPPKVVERLRYRADGAGYLDEAWSQVFVLPAEGGTPRQLTRGPHDHVGPLAWTPAADEVLFTANRRADAELEPLDTEVWAVPLAGGEPRALTDRRGPDGSPAVSPDGRWVTSVGFDDRYQGYQVRKLYVTPLAGGAPRCLTEDLDRSVEAPLWSDARTICFGYDDHGNGKVGRVTLDGEPELVAGDVGGTTLGRPYSSGSFDVAAGGRVAWTRTRPDRPAEVAVVDAPGGEPRVLTALNDDLFAGIELGATSELRFASAHDGREIQGWVVHPPGFDASARYPLLLEIHGGPFANYGERFSAECQLYAAAGYVVLYLNPRGSTSYGEEFGNLIHHAYPGHDYDDLMSGVDALLERGYVDPERLYVTGGSGGGVLTAWIVGKSDRFRAAVVAKPVINWTSFVLTADAYPFFARYWFPGPPWEHAEHYFARSPISLAGSISTPTMLLTGEDDYRTPISESEQLYQALQLRGVETVLVRIPGLPRHREPAQPPDRQGRPRARVVRASPPRGRRGGRARPGRGRGSRGRSLSEGEGRGLRSWPVTSAPSAAS